MPIRLCRTSACCRHFAGRERADLTAISTSLRAKRSNPSISASGAMDCFASLAMTVVHKHESAPSPRNAPESLKILPPKEEGAGNAGCLLHPRSRVQSAQRKTHTSIQVQRRNPAFPAQWLYGLLRALPATGFLATVAPEKPASRELDASIGASGPHDVAVRVSAVRQRRIHVHRIPPRVS
ncbi:hypothetical protein SAMN05443247_08441 [Bradyrhizobium erythrophlei]|jgi:hypothetical protein|nr:hypothetical protein SAMN05443247_08441 [Bradyrhizobium erythrophlei]